MHELYKRHRPTKLSQVIGQKAAVAQLSKALEDKRLPHALLFSGGSGTGKTTLARILAKELGAGDMDVREINCASNNGIDMIRDIQSKLHLRSMTGGPIVYILDEFHAATTQAMQSALKMLEDTPKTAYFFLCTTDPQKIIPTIKTRVSHIQLSQITTASLQKLIANVTALEDQTLDATTVGKIAQAAEGSARKALVLLEQVLQAGSENTDKVLATGDQKPEFVDIVRGLYAQQNWTILGPKLATLVTEDVEPLRRFILSWGMSGLTKGDPSCAKVMDLFVHDFFSSGKPGIILACFKAISQR